MKAIIFGSNGQDGFYLSNLLQQNGIEVIGVSRKKADIIGLVQDRELVYKLVKLHQPEYIFHLAANSTTKHEALWDNHEAISTGSLNILEAVKEYSIRSKVFLSGSGLQFENHGKPISENDAFSHSSPYVVSRNHSVYAARYYRTLGVEAYIGYFFNHDSPRRSNRHMAQKIAHYCKTIKDQSGKLEIGNIDVKKEWTFAGDIVEAVWLFVNQTKYYETILGSGKAYSIKEWLEICFNHIGKDWREYVVIKNNFISEYNILVSNPKKIYSLGWNPKVSIKDLAAMML